MPLIMTPFVSQLQVHIKTVSFILVFWFSLSSRWVQMTKHGAKKKIQKKIKKKSIVSRTHFLRKAKRARFGAGSETLRCQAKTASCVKTWF